MGQDPDVDAWIGVAEFFQGGKKDTVEGDLAGCNGNDTGLQAFIPGNLLFPIGICSKATEIWAYSFSPSGVSAIPCLWRTNKVHPSSFSSFFMVRVMFG